MTPPGPRPRATLACVATPELSTRAFREVATTAESVGLDELWLWEDVGRQSCVAQAGALLASTHRLKVGLGIMPVPLRNAVLEAMDIATLAEMFPDRVNPGLGHGVQGWIEEIGARVDSPLTLLREHAVAVRALLHGETVTHHGRYVRLDGVSLVRPPVAPPPLYVAGHGPRTLRVAGEVGDGVILQMGVSPEETRTALSLAAAGRSAEQGALPACIYVGIDAALRSAGAAATAQHLRRWVDAGATTVAVVPVDGSGAPDMADITTTVAWLGGEVRPLFDRAAHDSTAPTWTEGRSA